MPLETIAKQTQEAPVEGQLVVKDEKPTPDEAYFSLIDEVEDTETIRQLITVVNKVDEFFANVFDDLKTLTGGKVALKKSMFAKVCEQISPDRSNEVGRLKYSVKSRIEEIGIGLRNISSHHKRNGSFGTVHTHFPIASIPLKFKQDECVSFEWFYQQEMIKVRMIECGLSDPYDWPKAMPKQAKDQLSKMESLNFNWNPQVLDGILMDESLVDLNKGRMSNFAAIFDDPALTIMAFGARHVISYWREPLPTFKEKFVAKWKSFHRQIKVRVTAWWATIASSILVAIFSGWGGWITFPIVFAVVLAFAWLVMFAEHMAHGKHVVSSRRCLQRKRYEV